MLDHQHTTNRGTQEIAIRKAYSREEYGRANKLYEKVISCDFVALTRA